MQPDWGQLNRKKSTFFCLEYLKDSGVSISRQAIFGEIIIFIEPGLQVDQFAWILCQESAHATDDIQVNILILIVKNSNNHHLIESSAAHQKSKMRVNKMKEQFNFQTLTSSVVLKCQYFHQFELLFMTAKQCPLYVTYYQQEQSMKYEQLIKKCQELIESYNENIMTPDCHAQEFLGTLKIQDTERVFLKQVFYGYERYKNFLQASNNVIFNLYSTTTNRKNDASLFAIFTYLICFRLDELPFAEFKKMVLSQDQVKMNVLLSFIFDFQLLEEKVFEAWSEFLQMKYIEQKLMPGLESRRQKCIELIGKVSEGATGKKQEFIMTGTMQNIDYGEKEKKKTTVPQEFNLTKPKPKQLPEVQKIEVGFKARPAPNTKKDLKKIEDEKKKRRDEIYDNMKKYYEQNKQKDQFALETTKRPINLPKIKEDVQKFQTKELKSKVTARPMPKYSEVDVKLNVAAILRQQKKLNEKIEEEQLRMKNLEMNMRDQTQYEIWKKEMKEKDMYEQLENQQKRKIEMQLAREAAVRAQQEKIEEKKQLVEDMREIAEDLKREREKLEQDMIQEKKKIIGEVQEARQNIVVEREKVVEKNKKTAEEEKEQRRRILEKKKEEEKVEMQKKKELINEIRQLEKKIKARPKQEIQYVSIGLLEEMTLDQLKNKLEQVKVQRKKEEEARREANNKKKQDFKSSITQKKTTIMAAREQLAKQKEDERRRKKQESDAEKKRLAEVKAKSMAQYKKKQEEKLKSKQKEKEKLAKQIKETQQRRMFLMQGQAAQEANAFKNLQKGQERQILDRQNTKLVSEYKSQSIKEKDYQVIADANKKQVQQKIQFNQLYNQRQDHDNMMAETLMQEDQATRAMKYHEVRTYEKNHAQNMAKSNPYKTKLAQTNLSKAKNASMSKK